MVVPAQAFHILYFSILQGLGNYKKVVRVELIMNLSNLIIISYSTINFGLSGALGATVLIPLFYFITSFFVLRQYTSLEQVSCSKQMIKELSLYAAMTLFSAVAFPLLFILIRNHINVTLNLEAVGYWEAINQFSYFYFVILNSIMLMYVLPKITAKTTDSYYRLQVVLYIKKIMPLFALILVLIFFVRNYAIIILFSEEFSALSSLFSWQLLGDFFRALSLIFTIYFHARRMIWAYISIDFLLFSLLYVLTILFVDNFGLIGAVKAHFISYLVYFIVTFFCMRKKLFNDKTLR
jgi:PST family polysaccharide transporter